MQSLLLLTLGCSSFAEDTNETAREKAERQAEKDAAKVAKLKVEELSAKEKAEAAKLKEKEAEIKAKELEEKLKAAEKAKQRHHSPPPKKSTPPTPTPPAPTPPSPAPVSGSNPYADWAVANNIFNTPIGTMGLPVNQNNATWLGVYGICTLRNEFGTSYNNDIWGYALNTVPDSTPLTPLQFQYGDQADQGPPSPPYPTKGAVGYPLTSSIIVEGSKYPGGPLPDPAEPAGSDCHVFLYQPTYGLLYELYTTSPVTNLAKQLTAGSIFDLNSNAMRPEGWTSADAAGIAMEPVMCKYEEATSAKGIQHMLSFTVNHTHNVYDWPASHEAGLYNDTVPDMGAIWVLDQSFDISGYSKTNQAILTALKTYGMILSDNGEGAGLLGNFNAGWDTNDLLNLRNINLNNGHFVDVSSLQVAQGSYQSIQPSATASIGSSSGSTNSGGGSGSSGLSINESHHTNGMARTSKPIH